jgi:chromosome segregation ATPase
MEKLHDLDMKYNVVNHETELVVKEEEARRLKLRIVLMRDETDILKDQIAQRDYQIKQLNVDFDDLRLQLDSASEQMHEKELQLRAQSRQQANLKVNLPTLP